MAAPQKARLPASWSLARYAGDLKLSRRWSRAGATTAAAAGGVPDEGVPMPERMHAVVQQAFGGPEVLEVAEVDRPVPLATEVLVRVKAVGVNPVEPVIRSGQFPLIGPPPFILGWDISGAVEDSEGVTRFEVGDEVYGMPFFPRAASAYAEYVTAPSRQLARKPPGLSHAEAVPEPRGAASPASLSSPTIPASKPWPGWSIPGSSASISRRRCPWPRPPRPTSSSSPATPPARSR
jgi:alcohol dehydrogenase-like protein